MKFYHIAHAVFILSVSSINFAASISSMKKSEVMSALNDKTMTTISAATLNGKVIPNSFTGYFSKGGTMKGSFAKKPEDAPQADKGTWRVKYNGEVCVHWQQWFNGEEQCVYFYKLSNALLIINTNKNFESLVLNADLKSGDQTTNSSH